jgi:hypothetical protein
MNQSITANRLSFGGSFLGRLVARRPLFQKKRKLLLILIFCFVLGSFLAAYAYFSFNNRQEGNKIKMANLSLGLAGENGSEILPLDLNNIFPGWNYDMKGEVTNQGGENLIFRIQLEETNNQFSAIAKTTLYTLEVKDQAENIVYTKSGYLENLNQENQAMNVAIEESGKKKYSLRLSIPQDMDDFTTPENEEDNQYQGMTSEFDLAIQSTQAANSNWEGFPEKEVLGPPAQS